MKRILLFILVNLLVVVAISFIVNLLGIRPYLSARGIDYQSLLVFCLIWGFAGSFISLQLSRWTAKMAMGVQLIDPQNPGGSGEARLVETVQRLCVRAGLSTLPEIGIYSSPEVNAFATGPSRSRSLLAISTGLLQAMDSSAVEAVIGHEVAHIANGDMVTMTLIQGVVNAFVMFVARAAAFAVDSALRSGDRERGGGLGYFAQYMLIMVLESALMLLAAPLVYFYSRSREYRADAGGAQYSGRDNMIRALEFLKSASQVRDNRAPALSTFKINGYGRGLAAMLFSSHPPLDARIEALRRLP